MSRRRDSMNSKCPLCRCDITDPKEMGPVDHLMKAHKRTLQEAMDLVNVEQKPPVMSPENIQKAIENLERIGRMRR